MNSKERFLNAIHLKAVDHAPLYLRLWSMGGGVDHFPFPWKDQITRAENLLKLGVDDTLLLQPPLGFTEEYDCDQVPGISHTVTYIPPSTAEGYPILKKTYHTPEGELNQIVKITEDWPHGNNIMLFSDFNIPRHIEPIIKNLDDVGRIRHLLAAPSADQLLEFRKHSAVLHQESERLGVVLDGGWSALGDSAVWLCGMENVLYWQMEQPEILEAVLDVLLTWELARVDLLLEENIDVMVHMAWYEGTDFWTPKNYRQMIKPRLKQIIDKVHTHNIPFRYIITKGWKPLRKDLLEIGVDCITGVDPIQDNVNLAEVKNEIGKQICLMGGINAAIMLTQWDDEKIRQAIDYAFETLAPNNGFILFPVDNVFCELPWEKVEIVIDQCKKNW